MAKSKTRKTTRRRASKQKEKRQPLSGGFNQLVRLVEPTKTDVATERKRPRLLALLFCDFVNTTNDDKPNLLGVFDSIAVDREIKTTPHFFIFIRVAEITDSFETTVFNNDNQPVMQFKSVVQVEKFTPDLPQQTQAILRVQISQIEKEGVFWFDVTHKGNSLGGAGLPIYYKPQGDEASGTRTYI